MQEKCPECEAPTHQLYIRVTKNKKTNWVNVGSFCPVCNATQITPHGGITRSKTEKLLNKIINNQSLMYVVYYLYSNDGSDINKIIDNIPELQKFKFSEEKKQSLVKKLIKYNIIEKDTYEKDGIIKLNKASRILITKIKEAMQSKPTTNS